MTPRGAITAAFNVMTPWATPIREGAVVGH